MLIQRNSTAIQDIILGSLAQYTVVIGDMAKSNLLNKFYCGAQGRHAVGAAQCRPDAPVPSIFRAG